MTFPDLLGTMERRHPGGFCMIAQAIEAGKMPALLPNSISESLD